MSMVLWWAVNIRHDTCPAVTDGAEVRPEGSAHALSKLPACMVCGSLPGEYELR